MILSLALAFLPLPQETAPTQNVTVVDGSTGKPIEGVRVHLVPEADVPLWGEFWSDHDAAPTDVTGRTWLQERPMEEPHGWTIALAEGYAPSGTPYCPRPDAPMEIEMWPVRPASIQVVDFLGDPLPLVRLSVAVGCGHTPDVTHAFTDRSGHATLLAVGEFWQIADVYPLAEGVRMDYLDVEWEQATSGGYRTVALPGATLTGVVLDAKGEPCAGYGVGQQHRHRGPWTVTDARGRFKLRGVEPEICSEVFVKDPSGQTIDDFECSHVGMPRVLQLGAEPWQDEAKGNAVTLTLRPEDWDHPFEGEVPFAVWNHDTGMCLVRKVALGDSTTLELPAGVYMVAAGGQGSPFPLQPPMDFDSRTPCEGEANPAIPAPRSLRLEIAGIGGAKSVEWITAAGLSGKLRFDEALEDERGKVGVIESFLEPACRWALWLPSEDPHRSADLVDLEPAVDGVVRGSRRP